MGFVAVVRWHRRVEIASERGDDLLDVVLEGRLARVSLGLPEILAPRRGERMARLLKIVEFSTRIAELAEASAQAA